MAGRLTKEDKLTLVQKEAEIAGTKVDLAFAPDPLLTGAAAAKFAELVAVLELKADGTKWKHISEWLEMKPVAQLKTLKEKIDEKQMQESAIVTFTADLIDLQIGLNGHAKHYQAVGDAIAVAFKHVFCKCYYDAKTLQYDFVAFYEDIETAIIKVEARVQAQAEAAAGMAD
jgi:hypothetical protein